MAIRVEIDGTDRTSDVQRDIDVELTVQRAGSAKFTAHSKDASWRPTKMMSVEIWEPAVTATGSITSGSFTFTSTSLAASHRHVRIPGAGPGGATLRASLLSVTPGVSATIDVAASATVSGATTCLIGTARFLGYLEDPGEGRIGDAPNTREFDLTAVSLYAVLQRLYPRSSRPEETLFDRLDGLVSDTGADDHGIRVYWPQLPVELVTEDSEAFITEDGEALAAEDSDEGATLVARTYDGKKTFADVLLDLAIEDGNNRTFLTDAIGRIRMSLPAAFAAPSEITAAMVKLPASVRVRAVGEYFNQVVYHYGANIDAYVTVTDATEVSALDGRVFEAVVEDSDDIDATEATARATTYLGLRANRGLYQIQNVTLDDEEGFEEGQFATITIAERDVSGVHLIESVRAQYFGLAELGWRYVLTATNGDVSLDNYMDYWDEAIGE